MKLHIIPFTFFIAVRCACGQGFIYDQQSTHLIEGGYLLGVGQPQGQSFTPTLSSVGFVQLFLYGDTFSGGTSTANIILHSDSITGPILAISATVAIPDIFFGIADFVFPTPVTVTPGVIYYFQPTLVSGTEIGGLVTDVSYTGGTAIYEGQPQTYRNLWFREGAIPEPSAFAIVLLGAGVAAWMRRNRRGALQAP